MIQDGHNMNIEQQIIQKKQKIIQFQNKIKNNNLSLNKLKKTMDCYEDNFNKAVKHMNQFLSNLISRANSMKNNCVFDDVNCMKQLTQIVGNDFITIAETQENSLNEYKYLMKNQIQNVDDKIEIYKQNFDYSNRIIVSKKEISALEKQKKVL